MNFKHVNFQEKTLDWKKNFLEMSKIINTKPLTKFTKTDFPVPCYSITVLSTVHLQADEHTQVWTSR